MADGNYTGDVTATVRVQLSVRRTRQKRVPSFNRAKKVEKVNPSKGGEVKLPV